LRDKFYTLLWILVLPKIGDYKLLIQSGLLEKATYFDSLLCFSMPQIKLGSKTF
jgi:hypothetical protein